MISRDFYKKNNLISVFLDGKIPHYGVKNPSITIQWYEYSLKKGEDMYVLAEKVFGKGLAHLWTLIADNNIPRLPNDWQVGDIVRLPKIILRDTDVVKTTYSNESSTTSL